MKYAFVAPWKFGRKSPVKELCDEYLGRLNHFLPSSVILPDSTLADEQEASQFLVRELGKLSAPGDFVVCLDENGKMVTSGELAKMLEGFELRGSKSVCFCVGGAYGLPKELAGMSGLRLLSLSPMTLPHELALLITLEQVYRARAIMAKHPYHHGGKSALVNRLSS